MDNVNKLTSYGFCFRPDLKRSDCFGDLYLWVCHNGKTRCMPTFYKICHSEWDAVAGRIIVPDNSSERYHELSRYSDLMVDDLKILENTLQVLRKTRKHFTVNCILKSLQGRRNQ